MTKQTNISSIEVKPLQNIIQVAWATDIIDDDGITVMATTISRCVYGEGMQDRFIADVPMASSYINLIQW